jgi:hypothetical protein
MHYVDEGPRDGRPVVLVRCHSSHTPRGRTGQIKAAQEQDAPGPAARSAGRRANAGRDVALLVAPEEPVWRRVVSDRSCSCLTVNPSVAPLGNPTMQELGAW